MGQNENDIWESAGGDGKAPKHPKLILDSIKKSQGVTLEIGSIAAHPDDPITMTLVAYEDAGNTAVLSFGDVTKRWPASEIFDPNTAMDYAIRTMAERTLEKIQNAGNN